MKKIFLIVSLLVIVENIIAQVTQERTVANFSGIRASGVLKVVITQAPTNSIKVTADENDQAKIITEVIKDILEIYTRKSSNADGVTVYITTPSINLIEASGGVELEGTNSINTDKLKVEASGSSEVQLEVKAKEVRINTSGASTIRLKGSANYLIAETSGASTFKGYKLATDTVDVTASGASSARVNASIKINASASGASEVNYTGPAIVKSIEQSGAASINYREVKAEAANTKNDTTRLRLGGNKIIIISDRENKQEERHKTKGNFKHWSGFELSVNGYLNANHKSAMTTPYSYMELNYGKSFCFGLNIWEKDIHLYRNNLNLVTGFGFDFNNYSFSNKIRLNPDTSFISAINTPTYNYNKNRLKTFFLNVPVLLEVNTGSKPKRSFHIASGVVFGYKLRSRTKQSYTVDGYKFAINRDADFNINPIRANATVRVGYGSFTVFGTMALNQLFQANKGPELYPFTVGINLISW